MLGWLRRCYEFMMEHEGDGGIQIMKKMLVPVATNYSLLMSTSVEARRVRKARVRKSAVRIMERGEGVIRERPRRTEGTCAPLHVWCWWTSRLPEDGHAYQ